MGGPSGGSTGGGGGGVGPAGKKKDGSYGTKKDAKKVSKRNEFRTFIKDGGVVGAIVKGITGKTPYEANLERRKKFVKDKGLSSDDINMDASYLGSKEGLAELKRQGYKTASDTNNNTGGGNDGPDNQPNLKIKKPTQPDEGEATEPSEPIYGDDATLTDEEIALRNKRKGRKRTVLTSVSGDTSEATLSKKTLLGG